MIHPTAGTGRLGARVRELDSVPGELRGLAGTITQSFGHPDHPAYEMLLDGGVSSQLFWHYQLMDGAPNEALRERRPPTVHGNV
jgi:hypothetical protein